jgi:hypothetical protein
MTASIVRPTLALAALATVALAAGYESPRTFKAAELLAPTQVKGPRYQVAADVPTEAFLHVFSITTDFGPLEAEGRSMLAVRLDEVRALDELEKVSKSDVFLKAAGGAVLQVGKGVASVVSDPGATVQGMGAGVKRFGANLGRKAKRTGEQAAAEVKGDDQGKGQASGDDKSAAQAAGGVANSVLGVNASARKWAQKVGANPYTSNPLLKKALVDIGKIDKAGSIVTKVVVPIPPVVSVTAKAGNLVWGLDPEALLKKLYLSKGFTLTLHTRLIQALSAVKVEGCADYVAAAAEADQEREALFFTESAEMLQRLHAQAPVTAVLEDSRALVARTKDGRAVALLPLDWVRWSETAEKWATETGARAQQELGAKALELRLTGRVSDVARTELAARGWKLVENVPSTAELIKGAAR